MGAQWASMSVAVLKLMGIHQGATLCLPGMPGSLAVPQPSSPSTVKGLCSRTDVKTMPTAHQATFASNHCTLGIKEGSLHENLHI